MNPKADFYFDKAKKWLAEVTLLRQLILDCGLDEEVKWGCPCYTYESRNIVVIHDFKEYCALLFFKGALLKDTDGLLVQQTPNVQAARQLRFTSAKEIGKLKPAIRSYIYQAIEVEKAGLSVKFKKTEAFEVPEEFRNRLKKDAKLRKAFDALTPGRQRGYLLHFAQAKQSATREARIDKAAPLILKGKGLMDKGS